MNIRVIRGDIKHNDNVYLVGEILEVDDNQAKALVREGVAEIVVAEKPIKMVKGKVEKPVKEVKTAEVKTDSGALEAKPTMDWTQKEIIDYGASKGLEFVEGATKKEMLAIIEVGDKK